VFISACTFSYSVDDSRNANKVIVGATSRTQLRLVQSKRNAVTDWPTDRVWQFNFKLKRENKCQSINVQQSTDTHSAGFTYRPAFRNLFLPQHPFWLRLSSPAPPTIGLTPGQYKDKVKKSAVHLDDMLGSFTKTKRAIMAVVLTKTIRK